MRVPQPEKQTARPGLLIIFVVISIVLVTVWFRESTSGPLHTTRSIAQAITAPVSTAGEVLTRPFRGFFSWASDLGVSRSQLEQLRDQNSQLRRRVADLEEARLQNARLTSLLQIPQARDAKTLGAHIIGRPTNSWEGVITIDRGTVDGVRTGMPVIGATGLLGQTVSVTRHSAKVRLITDSQSGVAAMVQSSRAEGIVKGSLEGVLSLDYVSVDSTVTAGDVVITSGLGGAYPKGIIIGEVTSVKAEPNSLYKTIHIDPPSGVSTLEEVAVITSVQSSGDAGGGE